MSDQQQQQGEQERDQNLSEIMDELGVDSITSRELAAYLWKKHLKRMENNGGNL